VYREVLALDLSTEMREFNNRIETICFFTCDVEPFLVALTTPCKQKSDSSADKLICVLGTGEEAALV
jgi:hypothetical protein